MSKISVLDIHIDAVAMETAVQIAENIIRDRTPRMIATANAEMVMLAQHDRELAAVLQQAALVVPDGAGVVWAARHLGHSLPGRVAGCDLVQELLCAADERGYRVFFFGGAPGVAEAAANAARCRFSRLQVVGIRHGYYTEADEPGIMEQIKTVRPDILFTALGVPKQEKWLSTHLNELDVPLGMGVGGTFDVMAGMVRRAPLWMQRAGLEWLYRLLVQPSRAGRMLALPRFVIRVLSSKKD